jgi:MerR family transcriptional regulator, thiopeptide resistance regulator
MKMEWTIGQVARLARVSVRTLHHYDAVGLLPPSGRSEAGYRLYDQADLERLQQILFFKELGFGLRDIARIMTDPRFERRRALETQRALLAVKAHRLAAVRAALDAALEAAEKGHAMNADDLFDVFGDFDPSEYDDEARRRWGGTDAHAESARRTAVYGKADWRAITTEADEITAAFAAAFDGGLDPGDPAVQAIVERHWRHLERWFYTPTPELYAGLGDLYVNDRRFARNVEAGHDGLAGYRRAAMRVFARSDGASPRRD